MLIATFTAVSALSATASGMAPEDVRTLISPDGNLSMTFSLTEKGQPCYRLDYKDRTVILPSTLGFGQFP